MQYSRTVPSVASTSQRSSSSCRTVCRPMAAPRLASARRAVPVDVSAPATAQLASAALRASLVHAQMKVAAGLLANLQISGLELAHGAASNSMPHPRLIRADVATCFQLQAQVQSLCGAGPDSSPYTANTAAGRTRFLPMPEAKGGCITMPVFLEMPAAYLHDVIYCRAA